MLSRHVRRCLSCSNQPDHRYLDRHLVRDFLLRLSQATLKPRPAERSYDEQYAWARPAMVKGRPIGMFGREALEGRGIRVITIPYDEPLADQLRRHRDLFGNALPMNTLELG